MSKTRVEPGAAQALVELRRARILAVIGPRPSRPGKDEPPTPPERLTFFRREAEELYWNELAWEQMTDEEAISGGHLTELVFPGFLALVDGLLLESGRTPSGESRRGYADAVEHILTFLGDRGALLAAQLEAGVDSQKVLWARAMTLRLIDLVLYRLYRLTAAERERVENLA